MDYEKFEGKTISLTSVDGTEYEGYIVGCDYDIGITIVDVIDKKRYLKCLKGPSASPELYKTDADYDYYNEMFENCITMLNDGYYDARIGRETDRKYGESSGQPSFDNCPFNK
jgi:hypothetical protein